MTKRQKKLFADVLIALCIACTIIIDASVIYEYHRLDTVMPAGVVVALLAPFTGELLIICLRQVLGSDVVSQAKGTKSTAYYEEGQI